MKPANQLPAVRNEVTPTHLRIFTPPPPPPPENLPLNPLSASRRRRTTPLAWLFAAFALSCLAPANASAQTFTDTLALGTVSGINLNLILPVTTADNKTYYFFDSNNNGRSDGGDDNLQNEVWDTLLNGGTDTTDTQTSGNGHDGSDDARSVIINGYTLVLPTVAEFTALYTAGIPSNWQSVDVYRTATLTAANEHTAFRFSNGTTRTRGDENVDHVIFQVIVAPNFGAATIANQNYATNAAITTTLPPASGGIGTLSYTLTPIPAGMNFASATRTLSGAPNTETTTTLTYTVTDNAATPNTASLTFTVTVAPAPTFDTTIPDQNYTAGTTITTLTLPSANGGVGTLTYALTPTASIPAGLTYDPAAGTLSGAPLTTTTTATLTYTVTDSAATPSTDSLTFTVTVAPAPTFGADTIPSQTYPTGIDISVTLPTARGGSRPLSYTLTPMASIPAGLSFTSGSDTSTSTLSRIPTTPTATATLTYTVTDSATSPQTAFLTFTVTVVTVTGNGMATTDAGALAVNDVGGDNNDMRLILPDVHTVSAVAVTAYDPSADTAPPDGVTFSGVAMDIELSATLATNATVCLSTVGATGRTALYHLSASAWEAIGSNTGRFPGFVCGTTRDFSPFAVGSLEIEDARLSAISRTILPEVARAITDTTVSAIARRLHHAGADRHESGSVTLGGQSTLADILTTGGQALANGTLNLHNMVGRSAFVLPLNQAGDLVKGLTLWGGGDYRAIGGNGDATDWDGSLFSARLGADARVRANLLTGAALSWTQGDFEYGALADDPTAGGGDYTLRMTSLTPYVGWSVVPAGGLDVWATAGYGWGEVSITDTIVDALQTSDATTVMVGGGVSAQVLKTRTSRVRVKGELMQTSMDLDGHDRIGALTVEARRARLQVEGRHEYELAGGGRLGGTLEAGLRRDGGDGLTGTGAEMGGGVQYRHPTQGVTLSGQGRVLLGHTSNYEDWGIGAALTVIPGQGGEGLALRLSPTYGQTVTNTAQLWDQSAANLTGTDAAAVGRRMDAEVGYGLAIADGQNLLTPYGKLTWGQGTRDYRLGSRLTLASGLNLSLESRRGETPGAAAEHGVLLKVEWGW